MPRFRLPKIDFLFGPRQDAGEPALSLSNGLPELVIVGLGNPGPKYARTRHNIGFWCIDRLAKEYSIQLERRHQAALVGQGLIEGHRVALAKPRTYVNLSGQAASYLLARFKVSPTELLVIYDDVALPLGRLRLRRNGSAGGHNGIKSIIGALGTQEFPRLRVGIGRPSEGADQIGHVLGTLPDEEQKAIDEAVERVVQVVASILTEGIEAAMGRFN